MTLIELLNRQTPEEIYSLLRTLAKDLDIQVDPFTTDPTPAAVLIPLVLHAEPSIVLTKRTDHLSHHAGQISFPGGRMDAEDHDLESCVLRETHEEIGVGNEQIQMVSDLGLWPSYSGYVVKPFVGVITPPVVFKPCNHEVAEIFEIPLSVALKTANYELIHKTTPIPHHYYQLKYDGKVIWGLTAGLLMLLATFLEYHHIR